MHINALAMASKCSPHTCQKAFCKFYEFWMFYEVACPESILYKFIVARYRFKRNACWDIRIKYLLKVWHACVFISFWHVLFELHLSYFKMLVGLIFKGFDFIWTVSQHCQPIYAWRSINGTLANSPDPDQTPQNAASDQRLHCIKCRNFCKIWL